MAFTAFVSDAFSHGIVGWRTAASMPTELPLDALEMALWTRARAEHSVEGLVHHSDYAEVRNCSGLLRVFAFPDPCLRTGGGGEPGAVGE